MTALHATAALADLPSAFANPVHDAQSVFRRLLEAMARPGRIETIDAAACGTLGRLGISPAAAAVLLTVVDAEVRLWLDDSLRSPRLAQWLRFHAGAQLVERAAEADWLMLAAASATPQLWAEARIGTDEAPHRSATLLIDVPSLGAGAGLALRGPGIETVHTLERCGIAPPFWQARIDSEAEFPRGADLVLACGERIAALPRSTRLTLED
ncbi:MAG: phosphonate C-P lyase system protein PhnH [Rhizobacter sp.]